jgi:peptidoglycan/LPS O-acetylase OafA/YrhL
LRFFACALVLGTHAVWPSFEGPLGPIWRSWSDGGWAGVDLFFVLSGFLIGGILFEELKRTGTIKVGRFLIRRGWKIYPPFYAMIAFTIFFTAWHQIRPISWYDALSEIFFLQNYCGHLSLQTWSLAVEEHFYLLLPLLLVSIRRRLALLPWVIASIAVLCLGIRIVIGMPGAHIYTHARIDSLLFGVLLAYANHFHHGAFFGFARRYRRRLFVVGVILFSPPLLLDRFYHTWISNIGFTMLYVGSGMILMAAVAQDWKPTPVVKFVARMGACSYSIYLWHVAVLAWGVPTLERMCGVSFNGWIATAIYMVASVACGMFMARIIEAPCMRLRDRLQWASRRPALRTSMSQASA